VFTPDTDINPTGLVPSDDHLEGLSLLYTCRQIYYEASDLAYSLNYSITNRWHRNDLLFLQQNLVKTNDFAFKSLEFVSPWIRAHRSETGVYTHHTESFIDYEAFIFNVLELFDQIETIIIDVPTRWNSESRLTYFAETLCSCVALAIDGRPTGYSSSSSSEWKNWGPCIETQNGFTLVGKGSQKGRFVEVICQSSSS
jgi:hypothetical protein